MADKNDETVISIRLKNYIKDMIDLDREKYSTPRTSWIVQAIVERLERQGYDIK